MTVFIAHAEADHEVAENLQRYLERRGLFVERDSGPLPGRPLQTGDVLVALWSKDSPFSLHRLQFEKRALDAWADGRLIFVKLDHQFAPVGLRDLPFVDATFAAQRDLVAWADIAKRAQDARRGPPPSGGAPSDGPVAMGRGAAPPPASAPAPQMPRRRVEAKARAKGGGWGVVTGLVIVVGLVAAAIYLAPGFGVDALGRRIGLDRQQLLVALGVLGGVLVLGAICVALLGSMRGSSSERSATLEMKKAEAPAREEAQAPASEAAAPAVFVSYARADALIVLPVCEGLKKTGEHLWIDQQGIGAGEGWAGEIVRAIRTVRSVAVMCSKAAFESDHVKREVYLADRYKKRLLPVFIEETPMPDDFEYFFAGVQQLKLHEAPEAERSALVARALAAV